MEVVGHDAVGDDLEAAEGGQAPEEPDQGFFAEVIEEALGADDTGDAVVNGGSPFDFDAGQSHRVIRIDK